MCTNTIYLQHAHTAAALGVDFFHIFCTSKRPLENIDSMKAKTVLQLAVDGEFIRRKVHGTLKVAGPFSLSHICSTGPQLFYRMFYAVCITLLQLFSLLCCFTFRAHEI